MSRPLKVPDTVHERIREGFYPVTCCQCQHAFYAKRSIAMEMGVNLGAAACPNCKTYLHLELFPDLGGYEMRSSTIEDDTE